MDAPAQAGLRSIDDGAPWGRGSFDGLNCRLTGNGNRVLGYFEIWLRHDCFKCAPLRFHADVGVMLQHLLGDVPRNVPDGFVTSATLGKISDERVPVVMPTTGYTGFHPNVVP